MKQTTAQASSTNARAIAPNSGPSGRFTPLSRTSCELRVEGGLEMTGENQHSPASTPALGLLARRWSGTTRPIADLGGLSFAIDSGRYYQPRHLMNAAKAATAMTRDTRRDRPAHS